MTAVYTAPGKTESMRTRAGRGKWWLIAVALVLILIGMIAATSRPSDYRELSTGNLGDTGTHALAQILRDQGVTLQQYGRLASVYIEDPATTTLVVAHAEYLSDPHAGREGRSSRVVPAAGELDGPPHVGVLAGEDLHVVRCDPQSGLEIGLHLVRTAGETVRQRTDQIGAAE